MRILFLESANMWIYGLPNGLRDVGHEVIVSGKLHHQDTISDLIAMHRFDVALSLGWTLETGNPIKQNWISSSLKKANIPHVYWDTEDARHFESYTLPWVKNVKPNFVFTIDREKISELNKIGIKAAHLSFGYHPTVHYQVSPVERYQHQIAIVANGYPEVLKRYSSYYRRTAIETLLTPLVKQGRRVDLYGNHWPETSELLGLNIPEDWMHGRLPCLHANQVYSSADIMIGLQNELDELTLRSREVLASGGFLLTNDTPATRAFGVSGKDFVTSSSAEETVKLVDYYLSHAQERKQISEQGKLMVATHSYTHRAKYMTEVLQSEGIV